MIVSLISKGSDINSFDISHLNLILLFWIILIKNKLRAFNKKNKTPLHYSEDSNSEEMDEELISKGADNNAKDIIYLNIRILFLINGRI